MKRIFMVSGHPLFSQGVEMLLRQEQDLAIVGRETDADKAIERIKELRPDVIILEHALPECDPMPIVMRLLIERLNAKIIGLNLQANSIYIYREEQRMVRGVADLVTAIENDASVSELARAAEKEVKEKAP